MKLYANSAKELFKGTKVWSPIRASWFQSKKAQEKYSWVHVSAELVRKLGIEEAKNNVLHREDQMARLIGRLCETVSDTMLLDKIEKGNP